MGDDRKVSVYEAQRAHELELNRATAAFEHAVLSPLFLLNGGAAVAFLTLLGAASAGDSTLDVNPWFGGLAVVAWSAGLVTAAWAVRKGYEAQRMFTASVTLRRQLIERALLGDDADFVAALTPLPSERAATSDSPSQPPSVDDPRVPHSNAQRLQDRYLLLTTVASGWFIVGVILASVAVIP